MKDLPTEKIPFSYNTILRYGISFKSLNFYKFLFELKDIKCKSCNNKIIYKNKESKDKIFFVIEVVLQSIMTKNT